MVTSIAITPEEHRARCDALLERVSADGLSGVVLFDPYYVLYYAGFAFVPTERPIAFVLGADGTRALVVPRLELEHAQAQLVLDRVEHYDEYPGEPRAEGVLEQVLADLGVAGRIGADQDGYPWILGYRGPHALRAVRRHRRPGREPRSRSRWRSSPPRRSRSSARACAGGTSRTASSSATRGRA